MGMNWAYAMSQGAAHAAGAAADIADRQMKEEAEMRAADRKLSDQERLLAIQDAMKTRAAERFSGVVKNKAGEEIPLEAAPVTELTEGSAKLSGLQDGIQGDKAVVNGILKRAQETLNNPNATPEQKEDARGVIDQIGTQAKAQGDINAKAVEGKTRKRSWSEAVDAARQETLMTDAPAFIAGEGMLSAERTEERADKRAAATVKAAEVKAAMEDKKEEGRNARNREDNQARLDEMELRLEKQFGKGGTTSALVQNVAMLKEMGFDKSRVEDFIFGKKAMDPVDIAAKMVALDKDGEKTPEEHAKAAVALVGSIENAKRNKAAASAEPANSGEKKRLVYNPATGKVE